MSSSPRKASPRGEGLKLAIRYSLPSCRLGFCGPHDQASQKTLHDFVSGKKVEEEKVRKILEKFEAMYPYLRLIASSNQISDPFDEQVVKAFWVGNELLERVGVGTLRQLIMTNFVKPGLLSKEEAEKRAIQIPEGMVPHHSFHVFVLGSITGRVKLEGALKDLCRIGWGKVEEIKNQKSKIKKIKVKYQPLIFAEEVKLGEETTKEVEWDERLVPGIKEGDWVSFHWGQVCDLLGEEDVANLDRYTLKTISLISGK